MPSLRIWVWSPLAAAGMAGGAIAWTSRQAPRGKIHKIGKNYLLDARAVSELQQRLKWSGDPKTWVEFVVPYRGVFAATPTNDRPEGLGPLFKVTLTPWYDKRWTVDDLMIELVQYGLLEEGSEYARLTARPRDLTFRVYTYDRATRWARPAGQYFRVGDTFYIDEPAHALMMNFAKSRYEERDLINFWRRGGVHASVFSTVRMLPEQVGSLFRLEPHLTGTTLEELLTELVHYGLVGWGGEWELFPANIEAEPTGPTSLLDTPPLPLRDGVYFVFSPLVEMIMSRLDVTTHADGRITLHWRGNSYTLDRPIGDGFGSRGWLRLGREDDRRVQKLVDELVLRRIADVKKFD